MKHRTCKKCGNIMLSPPIVHDEDGVLYICTNYSCNNKITLVQTHIDEYFNEE